MRVSCSLLIRREVGIDVCISKGEKHNHFYLKAAITGPDSNNTLYNIIIERTLYLFYEAKFPLF